MNTRYHIQIDTFSVPHRRCRFYQEQIVDFYETGKPRFAWEKIRQEYILYQEESLLTICQPCPLNLRKAPEGCGGQMEELPSLLKAVKTIKPDSLLAALGWENLEIPSEQVPEIIEELESLIPLLQNLPWYVAQLFNSGELVYDTLPDGSTYPKFYPWNGENLGNYFFTNSAFLTGICDRGLLVKDLNALTEELYLQLIKQGDEVYARNLNGNTLRLSAPGRIAPAWEENPPQNSELRLVQLTAEQAFYPQLKTLSLFLKTAQSLNTGIIIKECF